MSDILENIALGGIRREANAFRIWREGTSVDWDCTADEMAEAVGLHVNTVYAICRERGWPINREISTSAFVSRKAHMVEQAVEVDKEMRQ